MISTVLEGATIIDGSGRPGFETDIAFAEERIALIGDCSDREARRRFDCRGKIAAPGFFDACSHTGEKWLTTFSAQSKSSQGILREATRFSLDSSSRSWEESLNSGELFDLLRRTAKASYVSAFVSERVRESAEAGAAGVWLDLQTLSIERAVALAREAEAGGAPRAVVLLRDNGDGVVAAVDEAIAIAERASVHVHIANHHVVYPRTSGRMELTLERIDRARTRGAALSCDVAPYTATWIDLASLLPKNVRPDDLKDDVLAAAVAMEMQARLGAIWHDLMLAEVGSEERMAWCGTRFDEIAKATWRTPARAVVDFIRDEGFAARAFLFCLREDDVAAALSAEFCAIGTAAAGYRVDETPFGLIHPRAFGTFPRIFGRFVRQRRTLTFEEAVRRMTSLPAAIFGHPGGGILEPEAPADVVVFDRTEFIDTATYERPFSLPQGLSHLFRAGVDVRMNGGLS